jgi:hypothetical protein
MIKNLSLLMITFIVFLASDIFNDSIESSFIARILNSNSIEQLIDLD